MLGLLVLAAVLEVGGDAAIRHGLLRASWPWLFGGALGLTAYGFVVNTDRLIDFGRLMGLYIAVFVVVSQLVVVSPGTDLYASAISVTLGNAVQCVHRAADTAPLGCFFLESWPSPRAFALARRKHRQIRRHNLHSFEGRMCPGFEVHRRA